MKKFNTFLITLLIFLIIFLCVYILLNFDPTKNKIILENYSECAITSPPPTDPPKTDPPQQTKPAPVMTAAPAPPSPVNATWHKWSEFSNCSVDLSVTTPLQNSGTTSRTCTQKTKSKHDGINCPDNVPNSVFDGKNTCTDSQSCTTYYYPPSSLSSNYAKDGYNTTFSGLPWGNGDYHVSSFGSLSNTGNSYPYNAFFGGQNSNSVFWRELSSDPGNQKYQVYLGGNTYYGPAVKLYLPGPIVLDYYSIDLPIETTGIGSDWRNSPVPPAKWLIAGSNDYYDNNSDHPWYKVGNWVIVDHQSMPTPYNWGSTVYFKPSNNTTAYQCYMFILEATTCTSCNYATLSGLTFYSQTKLT